MVLRTVAALSVIASTVGCAPPAPRLDASGLPGLRTSQQLGQPLGTSLSYLRSKGPGDTTVVWVHGTPGEAAGWADYVLEPPAGAVSVAMDRLGFGQSGPQGAVTSLAHQADAVAALLPPAPERVVLVGHSLGGAVVAWVAAKHPDRVHALVLLASSLDPAQESIHPMQYAAAVWPVSSMLPRALRNANDELMAFKPELQALQPLLARITAPCIIVHGTKDDLVPFANVTYMQSALRNARCLKTMVLQGQNHFLPWNSEPAVREAVDWALQQAHGSTAAC